MPSFSSTRSLIRFTVSVGSMSNSISFPVRIAQSHISCSTHKSRRKSLGNLQSIGKQVPMSGRAECLRARKRVHTCQRLDFDLHLGCRLFPERAGEREKERA